MPASHSRCCRPSSASIAMLLGLNHHEPSSPPNEPAAAAAAAGLSTARRLPSPAGRACSCGQPTTCWLLDAWCLCCSCCCWVGREGPLQRALQGPTWQLLVPTGQVLLLLLAFPAAGLSPAPLHTCRRRCRRRRCCCYCCCSGGNGGGCAAHCCCRRLLLRSCQQTQWGPQRREQAPPQSQQRALPQSR